MKPGVIYAVPPNRDVTITDHEVSIHEEDGVGPRPSVDLLFHSAAEVFRDDLIAVVLSGTGSDGAAGARAVKQSGGTVVIQNPETASFPGMPLSLAPSTVDIVADPDRIGGLLVELMSGAFTVPEATDDSQFRSFLEQLREESGIDFSTYKQPTLSRRLQRRMAATGQDTLRDYIRYVHRYPEERQRLVASFLIKVTEFFRDAELYTYLRDQLLPALIAGAEKRGEELGLWSAGCATGEEAYSLAMLVSELLAEHQSKLSVRIFATDLDGEAIVYARRGVYPARTMAAVPPALLDRYFTEEHGEYEVKKVLRGLLVFGEHDLGQRAPFPRIDLILCRNVLIYFTPALQRRALQLFAFSLRAGGHLVVGKSETVNPLAEFFALEQPRLKVFHRIGERALIPPSRIRDAMPTNPPRPVPTSRNAVPRPSGTSRISRTTGMRMRHGGHADATLLGLPVGVIVVDDQYDIQSINGTARRLLGVHSTALEQDLLHLVQHFALGPLRRAIDRAFTDKQPVETRIMGDEESAEPQRLLDVTCYPIGETDERGGVTALVAIVVTEVTEREQLKRDHEAARTTISWLTASNEELLSANQDLTGTISKLRTKNEELLVASEEVQAATEEVETLNEELQASNEELETLNEELQSTVEELNTTNDDLQARTLELQEMAIQRQSSLDRLEAILVSISDGVAVIAEDGSAVVSNPAYQQLLGRAGDRVVLRDTSGTPVAQNDTPFQRAARGESFEETFSLANEDGAQRQYVIKGRPVADHGSSPLGLITFREVTGGA